MRGFKASTEEEIKRIFHRYESKTEGADSNQP